MTDGFGSLGAREKIVSQFQKFGFLNVDVENGTKLIGMFYDSRDGSVKDHFTIKQDKNGLRILEVSDCFSLHIFVVSRVNLCYV
jgi:hypothetical protein